MISSDERTRHIGFEAQVATGASLDELMRRELFVPLGMADTGFFVPPAEQVRPIDSGLPCLALPGPREGVIADRLA